MQVTYGNFTTAFADLPQASQLAIIKRGITHYMGSEQASKVSGLVKKAEETGEGQVSDAARETAKNEFQAAAWDALLNGTVGTITRGPGKDPIDAEIERVAKSEVQAILKANNLKFTGKGDERAVTFADGQTRTMDAMIEKRVTDHADRLRKEAEKSLKAKAKELASHKTDSTDAASLGL